MQTISFKPAIQIQGPRTTTSARPCFAVRASGERESSSLPKLAAAFGAALLLASPFNGAALASDFVQTGKGSANEAYSTAALPPPEPSAVEEDGALPEKAPGDENKLPPQPEPEKESAVPAGRSGADSSGGKTGSTKSGGGILDFFGGSSSANQPFQKPTSLTTSPIGTVNEVSLVAALPPPDPSPVEEDGNLPEKAPGDENKLPPQPEPEKESAVPAGSSGEDSSGGKTGSTKSGGGILDFFGGSSSGNQPFQKPTSLITSPSASKNEVGSVAALPPPEPSPVEEDGNLPQKAPGDENKLPPQPEPEKESAVPAGSSGQDSSGGKTGSTKSGGGILDFFGGSSSGNQPTSSLQKPTSVTTFGSASEVFSVAALPAPQPSDVDEKGNLPQKAPGDEIKLPSQPKPESPPPEDLGKDSAGGKVSTNAAGKAAENVKKASASLPSSYEIGQIAEGAEEAVVEAVDENKPDNIKATLIGLAATIALEITIFSVQPTAEGKHGSH